jgi:hypothetical protein
MAVAALLFKTHLRAQFQLIIAPIVKAKVRMVWIIRMENKLANTIVTRDHDVDTKLKIVEIQALSTSFVVLFVRVPQNAKNIHLMIIEEYNCRFPAEVIRIVYLDPLIQQYSHY